MLADRAVSDRVQRYAATSCCGRCRRTSRATSPTTNSEVTINRYHVNYRRADGRNTPGVDVPYAFDGAVTGTTSGGQLELGFELVRHVAKMESPLVELGDEPRESSQRLPKSRSTAAIKWATTSPSAAPCRSTLEISETNSHVEGIASFVSSLFAALALGFAGCTDSSDSTDAGPRGPVELRAVAVR